VSLGNEKRRDRLVALLLFVLSAVAYYMAPVEQLFDYRYIGVVSDSLLTRGTLALPEGFADQRDPYQLEYQGGRLYHHFPNAPAVLNVPFALAFRLLGHPIVEADGTYRRENEVLMLRTSAATTTAATVVLAFLVARLFAGTAWSLAIAITFGFGTQLLSIASRPYWSHAWGILLLTTALWLALSRAGRRPATWILVATLLSWAVFCRPPFAFSVAALGLWLLARRRFDALAVYVASGLAWLALFLLYSHIVYDQALPPYFYSAQASSGRWNLHHLLRIPGRAAWGTLASPGRGLFLFTPFLLAIPAAVAWHWRRLPDRLLAGLGLAVIVANWVLVSSFRNWWGGGGFGPRLLTDTLPWWLLLAALAAAAWERAPATGTTLRRLAVAAVGLLALVSIAIHARGAYCQATKDWGAISWAPPSTRHQIFDQERLWNWRYPQFLAGLVAAPAPHFTSAACRGRERLEVVSCGPPFRIRVGGPPGGAFSVRPNTGRVRRGRFDREGKSLVRIAHRAFPVGQVGAVWSCGSVQTIDYACEALATAPEASPGE
jgi:hypothetical protein